jgi:hypothetical protein
MLIVEIFVFPSDELLSFVLHSPVALGDVLKICEIYWWHVAVDGSVERWPYKQPEFRGELCHLIRRSRRL